MSKQEFLDTLQKKLAGLPKDEIEERLNFYSEMIDDRIEEGLTEKAAIEELGSIEEVVSQIMADIPLSKLVKEKIKPNRTLKVWEIILLVLGSPLWLSFLLAGICIVIAVYAVIWSLVIALWAVEISLIACPIAGVFTGCIFIVQGNVVSGVAMFGASLMCLGFAILGWFGCKQATKGIAFLSKKVFIGIKSCFIGKENVQ